MERRPRRHCYVTSGHAGPNRDGQLGSNWERLLPNLRSAPAGEEQRLPANAARRTGHHRGSIALIHRAGKGGNKNDGGGGGRRRGENKQEAASVTRITRAERRQAAGREAEERRRFSTTNSTSCPEEEPRPLGVTSEACTAERMTRTEAGWMGGRINDEEKHEIIK